MSRSGRSPSVEDPQTPPAVAGSRHPLRQGRLCLPRHRYRRGEPPLTALAVHTDDGMVAEGYKEVLKVAGEPPLDDVLERELHAARARLACYRGPETARVERVRHHQ
ncbi:hypothetical protein FCI23_44375 [Actinacidiphila oryziradicis]|uniref:Uncharacterized protein n=1 Tax=Actinacidiphila oryziradicis TaxID=2571141 RepID=A0A4U0RW32_9ACTN|nr:hypothetical protein FCI23_44375 [Actinacidiphila oryziradicis]